MKTVPLTELHRESGEERVRKFIASIPDGEAVTVSEAMQVTQITGRRLWLAAAGACLIHRYYGKGRCAFLVNPKTSAALAKAGD